MGLLFLSAFLLRAQKGDAERKCHKIGASMTTTSKNLQRKNEKKSKEVKPTDWASKQLMSVSDLRDRKTEWKKHIFGGEKKKKTRGSVLAL